MSLGKLNVFTALGSTNIFIISCNDDFAHQSGARTLCVNPQFTNPHDTEKWHDVIPDMKNLEEILEFVNIPDEAKSINS